MSTGVDFKDLQRRMDGAISAFKHDLASLRTGRASANLLDPIQVQAYGAPMPINQVATVTVPEPRMISVSVWDKQLVGAVDRAIRESNLGFNPIVDGTNLRIPLPELNEPHLDLNAPTWVPGRDVGRDEPYDPSGDDPLVVWNLELDVTASEATTDHGR